MAKSKFKIHILFDSPVTTTFSVLVVLLFIVDSFITKGKLSTLVLSAPTVAGGTQAFSASEPLSFFRIVLHVFGSTNCSLLISNLIIISLLGPILEEKYGSAIIGIMMFLSALLSGVLAACFCKTGISGADSIVFMMVLLNSYLSVSKKKIPLSSVIVLILFIWGEFYTDTANGIIGLLVNIAGGLCGSLLAFFASPKARTAKKTERTKSESAFSNDDKFGGYDYENLDEALSGKTKKSLFGKKRSKTKKDDSNDETTVIGTIEL